MDRRNADGKGEVIPLLCLVVSMLVATAAMLLLPSWGFGVTSSTTVTATVSSATNITGTGCLTGTANVTDFGNLLPGSSTVTSTDCSLTWGSSNDSSMLRVYQADGVATTMTGGGWVKKVSGTSSSISGVAMATPLIGWAAGDGGYIRKTVDGGTTWTAQVSGTTSNLTGVYAFDSLKVWVVGATGTIVKTVDGGTTWSTLASGTVNDLRDIDGFDDLKLWAITDSKEIRHSSDGGATWTQQRAPAAAGPGSAIQAITATKVVAVASSPFYTTDGGTTWLAAGGGIGGNATSLSMANASVGYAGGASGAVGKTTDGGLTWVALASGSSAQLQAMRAISPTEAIAVGTGGTIIHTRDSGVTWMVESSGTTQWLWAIGGYGSTGASLAVGWSGWLLRNPGVEVPDYGASTWTAGTSMFAACLHAVSGSGVVGTWTVDAACPASDGVFWNAIPATSANAASKVAASPTAGISSATTSLRFGFRTAATQVPGAYSAPLILEVIAPNA